MKLKEPLASGLAYLVFGLFYLTYRFERLDAEQETKARAVHPQICLAIWHRNAIACLLSYAWRRLAILVSLSFDGEVIASVARRFGVHSARGSSSRGGTEALRQLLGFHKEGYDIGITVDGPRGPRYKVKPGIVVIASRTGRAILPYAAVADREWVLTRAWDHFRIPKPFAKIRCAYGEPIQVPRGISGPDIEAAALQVENALLALEDRLAPSPSP